MPDAAPFDLEVVDRLLTTTRAVRKRLDFDRPVSREIVEECLHLAFQAPTGGNAQNWIWIVVSDPDVKHEVAELYRAGLAKGAEERLATGVVRPNASAFKLYGEAETHKSSTGAQFLADRLERVPHLLLPAFLPRYDDGTNFAEATLYGSILPAVWSFMLALRSRGLGSAWTTVHLRFAKEMGELLSIPEGYVQTGLFPIGYTVGTDFKPADRAYSSQTIHWDRYAARD